MAELNQNAIFTKNPLIQGATLLTANTTKDLTSGTIYLLFTAESDAPSFVQEVVLRPMGTNVATVVRIFINNGSTTNTATNNFLIAEETMNATAVTETAALPEGKVVINKKIPAGYRIYGTIGTTVSAGIAATTIAESYKDN